MDDTKFLIYNAVYLYNCFGAQKADDKKSVCCWSHYHHSSLNWFTVVSITLHLNVCHSSSVWHSEVCVSLVPCITNFDTEIQYIALILTQHMRFYSEA